MTGFVHDAIFAADSFERVPPVLVCLLGHFRLLKLGEPLMVRSGGRTERLLCILALARGQVIRRESLIDEIWPSGEPALAGQCLNSLVHSVCKPLRNVLAGEPAILHEGGCYRLNLRAGVEVDVMRFEALFQAGNQYASGGNADAAMTAYRGAVDLHGGDLYVCADVSGVVERERLYALNLTALARLAELSFQNLDYDSGLGYAFRLLARDHCREDAYRMAMRCYTRRGERAQALRQYRLCCEILRSEFGATPEPATTELYDQVRLRPEQV